MIKDINEQLESFVKIMPPLDSYWKYILICFWSALEVYPMWLNTARIYSSFRQPCYGIVEEDLHSFATSF